MLPVILYQNLYAEGTITASSTFSGYDERNVADYQSYTKWKAADTTSSTIEVELSGAESCNTLAIYNHNFHLIGGTTKLQYEDGTWQDIATLTPTTSDPIMITFTAQSAVKFRLSFDTPTVIPEVAIITLGTRIEFSFPPIAPYKPVTYELNALSEYSEAGHLLGSVINHLPKKINARWENFTRTWFDTYFRPFWFNHAALMKPFFYAWDLTNRPLDIFYVTLEPNSNMSESLTILSITDEIVLNMKGVS